MMRSLNRRYATGLQHDRGPSVRSQPPVWRHGLVDNLPQHRMSKTPFPWHLGLADQVTGGHPAQCGGRRVDRDKIG